MVTDEAKAGDMSLQRKDLPNILLHLIRVKDQWETIGVLLGVAPEELGAIRLSCAYDCDMCLTAMICKWIASGTATMAQLKSVLVATNNADLASQLPVTCDSPEDQSHNWEQRQLVMRSLKASYDEDKSKVKKDEKAALRSLRSALQVSSAMTNGEFLGRIVSFIPPTYELFTVITKDINTIAGSYQIFENNAAAWANHLMDDLKDVCDKTVDLRNHREECPEVRNGSSEVDNTSLNFEAFRGSETTATPTHSAGKYGAYLCEELETCLDEMEVAADYNSYFKMAAEGVKVMKKNTMLSLFLLTCLLSGIIGTFLQSLFVANDSGLVFFGNQILPVVISLSIVHWSWLPAVLKYKIVRYLWGPLIGMLVYISHYLSHERELPTLIPPELESSVPSFLFGVLLVALASLSRLGTEGYRYLTLVSVSIANISLAFSIMLSGDKILQLPALLGGVFYTVYCYVLMILLFKLARKFIYFGSFVIVYFCGLGPVVLAVILGGQFGNYTGLLHPSVGAAIGGGLTAQYWLGVFSSVTVPVVDDYMTDCLQVLQENIEKLVRLKNCIQEALDKARPAQNPVRTGH